MWRRYLKLEPGERESYVDFLIRHKKYNEAARQLALICEDDKFVSKKNGVTIPICGFSLRTVSKHPDPNVGLDVDAFIRSGIQTFSDEVGRLWCATYMIDTFVLVCSRRQEIFTRNTVRCEHST